MAINIEGKIGELTVRRTSSFNIRTCNFNKNVRLSISSNGENLLRSHEDLTHHVEILSRHDKTITHHVEIVSRHGKTGDSPREDIKSPWHDR